MKQSSEFYSSALMIRKLNKVYTGNSKEKQLNFSYSGGRDEEDGGSRPARANSS
jgi:hypothetical protein